MKLDRRLIVLGIALGVAASCLSPADAVAQKSKDTLRVGFSFPFEVIDPYYTGLREVTMAAGEMIFDTLVYRDPVTFEHKPLLATSWKWVNDVTLELDLRSDVQWHDGVPFTADDVKYTFDYLINPGNKVWRPSWANWIKTTEVVTPHKIRLNLQAPFGPAVEFLSQVLPILPKDFYGPGGVAGGNGRLVGTGPYRLVRFEPGKRAEFEASSRYFAASPKGKPSIGKVVFINLPDQATQIAELISGGIDWMWRVPTEHTQRLASTPGVKVASGGTMRIFWFGFDSEGKTSKPLTDVRVRRAIAHAIDRKQLAEQLIGPGTQVLDVPCYPTQLGCPKDSEVTRYDFDPAKAKMMLAEAGYANGFETTMYIYEQGPNRVIGEAIQGYMRAIGIKTGLEVTTVKVFFDRVAEGKVPLKMESYGQYNINDVQILLPEWFAGGNRDSVRDKALITWMADAAATSDAAKRTTIYRKAAQRIMDQAFWVPLFVQNINYAFSSDLAFKPAPDENPRFYIQKWN